MKPENRRQKTILIAEPHLGGHRIFFVRWIAMAIKEAGYHPVLVTSDDDLADDMYRTILFGDGLFEKDDVISSSYKKSVGSFSVINLINESIKYWKWLRQSYKTIISSIENLEHVVVPSLDIAMYSIALTGSPFMNTPWSGIVMRPTFHLKVSSKKRIVDYFKESLVRKLTKNQYLMALFSNDELLVKYLNKAKNNNKIFFLPDPVQIEKYISSFEARKITSFPKDAFVILVYGHLTDRKGISILLESMRNNKILSTVHLIFAGLQHDSVKEIMNSKIVLELREKGRLFEINRILTNAEEGYMFAASDVVWLGYINHMQMSGVMVQAGVWGKPVITSKSGVMGELTKDHQLGIVLNENSVDDIVQAIIELESSPKKRDSFGQNGKRYFTKHDIHNVKQIFIDKALSQKPT